jgi:hypothetical protein
MSTAQLIGKNVSPAFHHDCTGCKFLGQIDGQDLYVCHEYGKPNYLRRFGDEGPDYGSIGDIAPPGTEYSLAAILATRAMKRGYVPCAYQTKKQPTPAPRLTRRQTILLLG